MTVGCGSSKLPSVRLDRNALYLVALGACFAVRATPPASPAGKPWLVLVAHACILDQTDASLRSF
jgi:hypothetical protein